MLRTSILLPALLLSAASSAQAQVTIPNTFTDGTPALASEVNANFEALASAVNASDCATAADVVCNPSVTASCPACPSCPAAPAAPACDTLGSYNQGFTDGVGNSSDYETFCASVGGTFLADPIYSCSVGAEVCATAGGTYDGETNSCSVDITTDNAAAGSAACTQAGGTWDAGTSTCTSAYNCFVAGFCAQAAIDWAPVTFEYTNVYAGHTKTTQPALGAGCNQAPGSQRWDSGVWAMSQGGANIIDFFGTTDFQCASY